MTGLTEHDAALYDLVDALNRLTLAVCALALLVLVLSWSLDDMALHVQLFGLMLRRLTGVHPADAPAPAPAPAPTTAVPSPPPAAPGAAKDATRGENHTVRP